MEEFVVKKIIVTTSINPPTEALKRFKKMQDWELIVVGDLKTPHSAYKGWDYMSPEDQEKYPKLSKALGWNSIQRRNIGFVEAYNRGADIIASVDDDNIPYDDWGENVLEEVTADYYETTNPVFDPLSVTNYPNLWHRGYPVELLKVKNEVEYKGRRKIKPLIQADLWDGDPDIDAICRITQSPNVKFDIARPFYFNKISPFNSQNTFLAREVFPTYFLFPFVGRMDDIWGSYVTQFSFPQAVIYNKASVYQERNPHDLIRDLENETVGYRNTLKLLDDWLTIMPKESYITYLIYQSYFNV